MLCSRTALYSFRAGFACKRQAPYKPDYHIKMTPMVGVYDESFQRVPCKRRNGHDEHTGHRSITGNCAKAYRQRHDGETGEAYEGNDPARDQYIDVYIVRHEVRRRYMRPLIRPDSERIAQSHQEGVVHIVEAAACASI